MEVHHDTSASQVGILYGPFSDICKPVCLTMLQQPISHCLFCLLMALFRSIEDAGSSASYNERVFM